MALLSRPNMMNWLTDYPNELASYQAGDAPFNLSCFTQESLGYLDQLLDQLANNDEYHRSQALHYANKEDRQKALQEMKQLLDEMNNKEVHHFVTNLREDQALQAANLYRNFSQKLQTDAEWQRLLQQHIIENTDIALQQYWQPLMPFAFCTSRDLIEKVSLLEDVDAYIWLAKYHVEQSKTSLPPAFQKQCKEWLAHFSQSLIQVRHAIVEMMLGILRATVITNDFTCDNIINTEVIPLLKQLGILKPKTPEFWLTGSFNASQFAGLVTFIQTQGTQEQQKALANLSLFESRTDDKLPLASVSTLASHFIIVPIVLKNFFTSPAKGLLRWLPHRLRVDRKRQEQCFGMETAYQMLVLNQQLRHIEQQLTSSNEHLLTAQISTLQLIKEAENQLNDEMTRTLKVRPRGVKAWLFSGTRQMMDVWYTRLQQQHVELFTQKITLAEQMVQTMKEVMAEPRVSLTPTLFKSVQNLFEELPIQLNTFSGARVSGLKQYVDKIYKQYQLTAQFRQHFLKLVQQPNTFFVTAHQVAHWVVLEFDRKQVHEWVQAYSTLVSSDEAEAMQLIGQIITGEAYPSEQILKETLQPLFQHQVNPEETLEHFIDNFLGHIVLPCVRRIQDPAYQFVNALAPALARQWVKEHRTQLEGAIQLVQYIFNVELGHEIVLDGSHPSIWIQEETVNITQEKVLQGIQHICALSTPEQDHTTTLLTAAQHYLEHGPQHVGYMGDNLTYQRIISGIALATGNDQLIATYGGRRFRHLLAQYRYQSILQDPFLLEHGDNPKLKQALQMELDHILAEPLGDNYIGLLPIIQQWGFKGQAERYAKQRDQYYLKMLTKALSDPSSVTVIDDCLQHLKRLNEPFPQSPSGHYQLQALFCESADEVWQRGKQHLVTMFGDNSSQETYRLIWLKTFLFHPSLSEPCSEEFDYRQPYAAWISALGKNQVAEVHTVIDQFLNNYDHSHPTGLEVVKHILSSEWVTNHQAQSLADKLAAIEQICQRQVQLDELSEIIKQQLNNGEYKKVAHQFTFLLKQQAYCKERDIEHYSHSKYSYQAAMSALLVWVRQAVFTKPISVAWVGAIILPVLPEGEEKIELTQLCQSAENSRFAYDCLYLALVQLASNPSKTIIPHEANYFDYLMDWPLEKQLELANQIDVTLSRFEENHPLQASLLALQRLLLSTSTDKEGDHTLLLKNSQQISSLVLAESSLALQTKLEQQYLTLLRAMEKGDTWEADEFNQLICYYRISSQLPELHCSKSFTQAVTTTLEVILERVLNHLSTPSEWSQLIYTELERKGQQVIDDCEFVRALANSQAVTLLDKTLNQWLQSYSLLFAPMPTQSTLPQVMYLAEIYEQVLSLCGNTDQQTQIAALAQLRAEQRFTELNQSCTTALQKINPNCLLKSKASEDSSFLSTMNHTLKKLLTSPSSQKPLTVIENLSSRQEVRSSNEDPSTTASIVTKCLS
jgi:hypothetical protein